MEHDTDTHDSAVAMLERVWGEAVLSAGRKSGRDECGRPRIDRLFRFVEVLERAQTERPIESGQVTRAACEMHHGDRGAGRLERLTQPC